MEEMFGDSNPFSDFFTTFFGGGGSAEGFGGPGAGTRGARGGRGRQRPGRDVEHELELTLEDAYQGATRRLSLKHDGHSRTVDVRIPAGVGDGSRVRVAGEGEHGVGGAAAGDLYLRVRLAPHPVFERKGRDLYVKVPVPVTTAVLGGEADVQTMAGKAARLRIPPLTQNGQVFRLKGYGMPAVGKPDDKGDLYARVEVQLPAQLTTEEREHYEALAKLTGGAAKTTARRDTHEYQQVHRKGPGSGPHRAEPRQRTEPRRGHARAPAGRARRAVRRHRPVDPAQAERSTRRGLRRTRAALLTSLPQAYGADVRLLAAHEADLRFGAGRGAAAAGRVRQHRAPVRRPRHRSRPLPGARSCCSGSGVTKDALYAAMTRCAATSASPRRTRSPPTRRSPATGAT